MKIVNNLLVADNYQSFLILKTFLFVDRTQYYLHLHRKEICYRDPFIYFERPLQFFCLFVSVVQIMPFEALTLAVTENSCNY